MLRLAPVALAIASVLAAQAPKSSPKVAPKAEEKKELPTGYVLDAVLIKDEDCIKDVVRAAQASGVEQRKQTAELAKYGCIEEVEGPYYTSVTEVRTVAITAGKRIKVYKAILIFDIAMRKLITGKDPDIGTIDTFKEGWLFQDKLHVLTKEQFAKMIEDQKRRPEEAKR
jgi:hypothetical protein